MIAIVSDSHIPSRSEKIPGEFWEKIEDADITVHAGDYAREETFNALETYSKEFYGVKGNCDFFESDKLKDSQSFEQKDLKFGVYHGTGISPRGHKPTLKKIAEEDLDVDVLIHGHTHQEDIDLVNHTLLLNPGSCTGVGGGTARPTNPTMIILKLDSERLKAQILVLEDEEIDIKERQDFSLEEIKKSED